MKIIRLIISAIIISIALFLCSETEIKAASTYNGKIKVSEYVNKTYVKMVKSNGWAKYLQVQVIRRSTDNEFVYCIQPFVSVVDDTYKVTYDDYKSVMEMTEEQWERISLLAYYGYKYGNHTETKWYAITQVLIWRTMEPTVDIYFTSTLNGSKDNSIYQSEISELETLVSNHKNKPSFDVNLSNINVGESITLTDKNNVLKNYSVNNTNNIRVETSNNQLTITAVTPGESELTFKRVDTKYNTQPALYYADVSQAVIRVGSYDPINVKMNLKVIGGKVRIQKLDRETLTNIPQGEASLEDAEYGIYDKNNNLIEVLTTASDGTAQSGYLPYIGTYTIKEIKNSKGYKLDNSVYYFEIKEDYLNPEVIVFEEIIKSKIEIHKYFANGETGKLIPEPNVQFKVFDREEALVTEITTNNKGYASFELPYGTYKVKQATVTPGYEKIKDFLITINENSENVITYSFSDARITARLKVIKIDAESKKPIAISNIRFKIKNIDTDEYVCQKINYPKKETICEYLTDDNGEFTTPEPLVSGTYLLEEIEPPSGYILNEEGIQFRIDNETELKEEDFKYIEILFANKQKKGQIKVEKTGELFQIENNSFNYKQTYLENVEISLYAAEDIISKDGTTHYLKGDMITSTQTNINGLAVFDDLYLGKYIVKETKALEGYVLEEKEYVVELTDSKPETLIIENISITNKLEKGKVVFTKTDFITGEVIPNTKIELYTEYDELIYKGITDSNGEIIIEELKVGKYYFIEIEPATGYVITEEKVYFEIKENGEIVKTNMNNKPITGTLVFSKIDFSTSDPLPNTLIEIYNENEQLVYSNRTNENGEIVIEELRYGKYFIIEKEAPEGYLLNPDRMYFEIKEDGEIIKTTMVNERIVIEVPDTLKNKSYIYEITALLLIMLGVGGIIYATKRE